MEHADRLIQYLSVLKEVNKEVLVDDRIHNTCDAIERELGIKDEKKPVNYSVTVDAKDVIREVEELIKKEVRRGGVR